MRVGRGAGEKGSVLLIVAVALVFLLGLVALVVDIGMLLWEHERLVRVATAAALAGVQALPEEATAAVAAGKDYAQRNGAGAGDTVEATVGAGNTELTVRVAREVPLHFARILGFSRQRVVAQARARVAAVRQARGVMPFSVVRQGFIFGQEYILKYGAGDGGGQYHGNFGALALGGRGACNYRENIRHGYPGTLSVGDRVETEPGNMAGPTRQAVEERLEACNHVPACTYDHFVPGCPRFVIVPVIDSLEGVHGRGEVEIVGFAAFFLSGVNQGEVRGYFLRWSLDSEQGEGEDFGLRSYRLVSPE